MNNTAYRPDIDGIRALAVLSVLLFHLDIKAFGGGYVGVDVFFVISGFLITRLIKEQVEQQRFAFADFYVRRARRLLPALFFTFAVCLVMTLALFAPVHLVRFGGEQLFALLSVSNFYFWQEAGYFDTLDTFKPLLHTWSLSVEEQFYFFWPVLLLGLLKLARRWQVAAIFVGSVVSLFAAQYFVLTDLKPAVFYLLPFRAFEFGIGALMVWALAHPLKHKILHEILYAAGLFMVLYAVFVFTKDTPFPGINALLPCLGTALLIYNGAVARGAKILNNRLCVWVGLISYSLYLIHWPLIVFTKYYTLSPLTPLMQIALLVGSIAVAYGMYRHIEKPFRVHSGAADKDSKLFVKSIASIGIVVAVFATILWTGQGMPSRFSPSIQQLFAVQQSEDTKRQIAIRAPNCHMNQKGQSFAAFKAGLASCNPVEKGSIMIVGDSHAADLYVGFSNALKSRSLIQMTGAGCGATSCLEFMEYALDYAKQHRGDIDAIFYTQRGKAFLHGDGGINEDVIAQTKRFLQQFKDAGLSVYWLGPQIEHEPDMTAILARSRDKAAFEALAKFKQNPALWRLDAALSGVLKTSKIQYISKLDALCPNKICPIFSSQGELLYPDYGHWSVSGAQYFTRILLHSTALSVFVK